MKQAIITVQVISALLVIASVLMQQRGSGLGGVFGGEGAVFRTKRGIEKGLYIVTILSAAVFFAALVAAFVIH